MQRLVGLADDVGLQEAGGKWGLRRFNTKGNLVPALVLEQTAFKYRIRIEETSGTSHHFELLIPHPVLLTALSFFAFSSPEL